MDPAVIVKEKVTGVEFGERLIFPGVEKELVLVGKGVRERKIMFIHAKVYAVALYVDKAAASEVLLPVEKEAGELQSDPDFLKSLGHGNFTKVLVMVLVRDVTYDQFWGRLKERLDPFIKDSDPAALLKLAEVFKGAPLRHGTRVYLGFVSPSTLHTSVFGPDQVGPGSPEISKAFRAAEIESSHLLRALGELYFGPTAPAPAMIAEAAATIKSWHCSTPPIPT
eukprot:TRINITY_DN2664_c0_g1_i1.p1 TRINITY_DN2664_c0_g1~~TRINITY_DN2664_c0_g1_i1.p1  ORF type:complete len:247 (+),score=51.82 TRINITY_DN2664_c0_g1_i1:72-743(+)